jgi:hypothetical protein
MEARLMRPDASVALNARVAACCELKAAGTARIGAREAARTEFDALRASARVGVARRAAIFFSTGEKMGGA